MDPVIGAAALTVLGGLMSNMMQRHRDQEAQDRADRQTEQQRQDALAREQRDRIDTAKGRVQAAQSNQLNTIRGMGQGEQDSIGQLMAALSRTAR